MNYVFIFTENSLITNIKHTSAVKSISTKSSHTGAVVITGEICTVCKLTAVPVVDNTFVYV